MKLAKKIIFITVLLFVCAGLIACGSDKEDQQGIVITEPEINPVVSTGFDKALEAILDEVIAEQTDKDLEVVQKRIIKLTDKAEETLRGLDGMCEEDYVAVRDNLINNKTRYKDIVTAIYNGDQDIFEIKKIFLDFIGILGERGVSDIVFDMLTENFLQDYYEKKDGEYREATVKSAEEDYKNFRAIGKDNFSVFFAIPMVLSEMTGDNEDNAFTLTNAETVTLVKKANFSNTITADGWRVLLKSICGNMSTKTIEGRLYKKSLTEAQDGTDDLDKIAERMVTMSALFTSFQQKLTADAVQQLRDEKTNDFIYSMLSLSTEEDWNNITTVMTISLTQNYYAEGYEFFGKDFDDYDKSVTKYTVQDLRDAVTNGQKERLSEIAEGITASASTTFAYYGWKYDRDQED